MCISILEERLNVNLIHNTLRIDRIFTIRSHGLFYNFRLQPSLTGITFDKLRVSISRLRMSFNILKAETSIWQKTAAIPFNERMCT